MVSEQDLRSTTKCSKMSEGKLYSIPKILYSYISRNHYSDNRYRCPLVCDFGQLDGQFYIEEFLDWLVAIERFFKSECIAEKKHVKFVESKLKGKAWDWWEQLQRMRTRLGKVLIQNWIKLKK